MPATGRPIVKNVSQGNIRAISKRMLKLSSRRVFPPRYHSRRDRWRRLAREHALRAAFVRRPLGDEGSLYSCGMHLLGQRDIVCASGFGEEAVAWTDALATHLVDGNPLPATFSPDRKTPARKLQPGPCTSTKTTPSSSIPTVIFASPTGELARARAQRTASRLRRTRTAGGKAVERLQHRQGILANISTNPTFAWFLGYNNSLPKFLAQQKQWRQSKT